ncbi:MAG: hypothetical protein ACJ757_12915 [Gaiellaceae bacterium]
MPVSTEAPLRLPTETKEKVQLLAALLGLRQGELVTQAIDEYIASHADELDQTVVAIPAKLGVPLNSMRRR